MKKAIAETLNLREEEFGYDINEEESEVVVWGDRIDTVIISIDNLDV